MEKSYYLAILTPEKKVFTGEIISLVAPGELGYLGILANHAPLITALGIGKIIIRDKDTVATSFQTTGGFLEVINNRVTILAETVTA